MKNAIFIAFLFLAMLSAIISLKSKKFKQDIDPDLEAFKKFKEAYNKKYPNVAEENKRFQIFKQNLQITKQNMKDQNIEEHYTGRVSKFADLTYEEFSSKYLDNKLSSASNVHVVASSKQQQPQPQPDPSIPSIDLTPFQSPVKDQGQCGSCYAFAAIAALESSYIIQKQSILQFSEQQIVDCNGSNYGCNGGWSDVALNYLNDNGIKTNVDYPYTSGMTEVSGQCLASSFVSAGKPNNTQKFVNMSALQLCSSLSTRKLPFIVYMYANTDLQLYIGGVLNTKCPKDKTNHAVLVVGCGNDSMGSYLKIKNSWGSDWGENGYFRMKIDICGIGSVAISTEFS